MFQNAGPRLTLFHKMFSTHSANMRQPLDVHPRVFSVNTTRWLRTLFGELPLSILLPAVHCRTRASIRERERASQFYT
jgi:hypothetical protein